MGFRTGGKIRSRRERDSLLLGERVAQPQLAVLEKSGDDTGVHRCFRLRFLADVVITGVTLDGGACSRELFAQHLPHAHPRGSGGGVAVNLELDDRHMRVDGMAAQYGRYGGHVPVRIVLDVLLICVAHQTARPGGLNLEPPSDRGVRHVHTTPSIQTT